MPKQLDMFGNPRKFVISIDGYTPKTFTATSAGKARAMAYRAFREAHGMVSFYEFIIRTRVRRTLDEGRAA